VFFMMALLSVRAENERETGGPLETRDRTATLPHPAFRDFLRSHEVKTRQAARGCVGSMAKQLCAAPQAPITFALSPG
jgi:hypothetical protein